MADEGMNKEISEDNSEERRKTYLLYWQEAIKAISATSDMLDKYILTLSSAFLGGSLTIAKIVRQQNHSPDFTVLYLAGIFLILAIISTLISFKVSVEAQYKALELAERYYLENEEAAIKETNWAHKALGVLNCITLATFVVGVISLTLFAFTNL